MSGFRDRLGVEPVLVRAVFFFSEFAWVGIGVDFDLAAQANSRNHVVEAFRKLLWGEFLFSRQLPGAVDVPRTPDDVVLRAVRTPGAFMVEIRVGVDGEISWPDVLPPQIPEVAP